MRVQPRIVRLSDSANVTPMYDDVHRVCLRRMLQSKARQEQRSSHSEHPSSRCKKKFSCRMSQKLSATGNACHINCPPDPAEAAIFVTACHINCPRGLPAFCSGGLFDATIVYSLQAVAQQLSVAYTERLLSFLMDGGSTRPLVFPA
jgi:hypothetical protein